MEIDKITESKAFKYFMVIVPVLIILILVFGLGVYVGYRKAKFSYSWGENYEKNFPKKRGFFGFMPGDIMNAHGTVGSVSEINGNIIVLKDNDGTQKSILTSSSTTVISRPGTDLKLQDIKVNDAITVIGMPNNQGQIEAKLIRIF